MKTDKPALLVSACLFGEPVRYNGTARPVGDDRLAALAARYRLVPLCPECLGGLPTPRPPAEIAGGTGAAVLDGNARVITDRGEDVSAAFVDGAAAVLAAAGAAGARVALLKARSPSCGSGRIHDGSFTSTLVPGDGVTAALLCRHGIRVVDEQQLDTL